MIVLFRKANFFTEDMTSNEPLLSSPVEVVKISSIRNA